MLYKSFIRWIRWQFPDMPTLNLDNMSNHNSPYYSDKYTDDKFEYRHVHIPREWVKAMPKDRTMTEQEWRELGKFFRYRGSKLECNTWTVKCYSLLWYSSNGGLTVICSFRCSTVTRMGPLYDPRTWATCFALPPSNQRVNRPKLPRKYM